MRMHRDEMAIVNFMPSKDAIKFKDGEKTKQSCSSDDKFEEYIGTKRRANKTLNRC